MASIEYITKRIEGKEKEITKLTKKLDRIMKAKATNWEVNPYYYHEDDIKWTTRDLDEAKAALEKWQKALQEETDKANSRNVKAILEFLEGWKARVKAYYIDSLPAYIVAREDYYKEDREYCNWWNSERHTASKEEIKERERQNRAAKKMFTSEWSYMMPYIEEKYNGEAHETVLNIEKLDKDLTRDAELKYDDIINRTCEVIGKITDASGLSVGAKGELNGYIIGENGTAKVNTIGAGGYNIQCFHFRTLVHKVK